MMVYLDRKERTPTQTARPRTTAAAVGEIRNKIISNSISMYSIVAGD